LGCLLISSHGLQENVDFKILPSTKNKVYIVSDSGETPDSISATVDHFTTLLEQSDESNSTRKFRRITWDRTPEEFSAPNRLPSNFFLRTGLSLLNPVGGFMVSAGDQSSSSGNATALRFGNLNPDYEQLFSNFSAQKLFTPLDSTITVADFVVPSSGKKASITGFGVVFTNVQLLGSATVQVFDDSCQNVGTFVAPIGNLSFVGVFLTSSKISRVILTSGTTPLGRNTIDDLDNNINVVAMDDFFFSEPKLDVSVAVCQADQCLSLLGESEFHPVELYRPDELVEGRSIAEWAGEWWHWAINTNFFPILDQDGGNCTDGQDFDVFFLAGCFNCSEGLHRVCFEVPPDVPVFVAILNFAFLEKTNLTNVTTEFLLDQVRPFFNQTETQFLEIDGQTIDIETEFRQISEEPVFFTLETDLLAGDGFPNGTEVKLVAAGWHVILKPMREGERHVIHFGGHVPGQNNFIEDVTYDIGVFGPKRT